MGTSLRKSFSHILSALQPIPPLPFHPHLNTQLLLPLPHSPTLPQPPRSQSPYQMHINFLSSVSQVASQLLVFEEQILVVPSIRFFTASPSETHSLNFMSSFSQEKKTNAYMVCVFQNSNLWKLYLALCLLLLLLLLPTPSPLTSHILSSHLALPIDVVATSSPHVVIVFSLTFLLSDFILSFYLIFLDKNKLKD
jgi:hypothetical protein